MDVKLHSWFLLIGALLLGMAMMSSLVKRLPVTPALIYLVVGFALGPMGMAIIRLDPLTNSAWLYHAAEVAVVISLFTVGLKIRLPWLDRRWKPALLLAFLSMAITVALVALVGVKLIGLPLGAAILLGGILAPTDPVLASDVQLRGPTDRDHLRLTLTGEAGFNDGTAFPFVILGVELLDNHTFTQIGWHWFWFECVWSGAAGLAVGGLLGHGIGRLVVHLRANKNEALGLDEYLALGLIGVAYGAASQIHGNAFLSVFAAALSLRAVERRASTKDPEETIRSVAKAVGNEELAKEPSTAPAYLAGTILALNEHFEHIAEVGVVLLVGAVLLVAGFVSSALWFIPLLFFVIRPLSVLPVLGAARFTRFEFGCIAWFGIRGIGSVYYLMYAIQKGLPRPLALLLASLTLTTVATSILIHGVSGTPILNRSWQKKSRPAKITS